MDKTLRFNIIYTPGTVRYLRLFALSLLKWSDCSFRLVANGCSTEETQLLYKLCQSSPRLEFLALPFATTVQHHQALNYLQSIESLDTFCFMDSDILATGDFLGELRPYLDPYSGIFSGAPMTYRPKELILPRGLPSMVGRFTTTDTGLCLGCTYLAMYDNRILTELIQSTGINFDLYHWQDISIQCQNRLVEMGLRKKTYDTGKVLNLLLYMQGERLVFVESTFLKHLCGISTYIAYRNKPLYERLLTKQKRIKQQIKLKSKQLALKWTGMRESRTLTEIEQFRRQAMDRTPEMVRYSTQILHALFHEQPLPPTPNIADCEIRDRVEAVTMDIVALYEEFKEQLV